MVYFLVAVLVVEKVVSQIASLFQSHLTCRLARVVSLSLDSEASTVKVVFVSPLDGVRVKDGVGGALGILTVTLLVTVFINPPPSCTSSLMV